MKKYAKNQDYYFYEGQFYTEFGLKRALIKNGTVWVSRGTFYCYLPMSDEEIHYHRDYLRDILFDKGFITEYDRQHFQKWINAKFKEGTLLIKRNCTWYHCEETDGMGCDWWECLGALRDGFCDIQTDEEVIDEYCEKDLTNEEFEIFCKLSDARQFYLAKKWKLNDWKQKNKGEK